MATPIAHKGATAGAKVVAMTVMDFLLNPNLLKEAKIILIMSNLKRIPTGQ